MLVLFFTYTWHCIPGTCALAIGAGGRFTDSSSFRAPPAGDSVGKGIGGVVGNVTNPKQTLFYFLVPKGLLYPQGCFCSGRLLELFGKIEFF